MSSLTTSARPRRRDYRLPALAATFALVAITGYLISQLPDPKEVHTEDTGKHPKLESLQHSTTTTFSTEATALSDQRIDPREDPQGHEQQVRQEEIKARFDQAVMMLHAKRYDDAITALHRLIQLAPTMPEAHSNLGYAFLGKQEFQPAKDFFMSAIDLNPGLANAHYGIAIAFEGLAELDSAMGGMRSFLHLTDESDYNQIHVARARSAIWEWESKLGRGPWGPTKGILPGLTAEDVKRVPGKGMGTMMQIPGTRDENGVSQFEIKLSDHIPGQFKP